jgi:hypothetical protein
LINKNIDPGTFLSGDRNALMTAIRISGYGNEFTGNVQCSSCDATTERKFDLAQLEIKRLDIQPVSPGENSFEFMLPRAQKKVCFKFNTVADEEVASLTAERQKKLIGVEKSTAVTAMLFNHIVSVNGITERSKIMQFVNAMPAGDSLALREYIQHNEPGISQRQVSLCEACGAEAEVMVPMDTSFLWPHIKR